MLNTPNDYAWFLQTDKIFDSVETLAAMKVLIGLE